MWEQETVRIPYDEYRAIGEIFRAHLATHAKQLRAVVAFGPLVTHGGTFDIDLLEVVEGWQGPASLVFASTSELPLRGQLRLYLMTPEEFEHPENLDESSQRRLISRIREGYDVIYENPPAYALDTLTQRSLKVTSGNPLNILISAGTWLP